MRLIACLVCMQVLADGEEGAAAEAAPEAAPLVVSAASFSWTCGAPALHCLCADGATGAVVSVGVGDTCGAVSSSPQRGLRSMSSASTVAAL